MSTASRRFRPSSARRRQRRQHVPSVLQPRWVGLILRTARRARADLILCRDLPLAPTALGAGAPASPSSSTWPRTTRHDPGHLAHGVQANGHPRSQPVHRRGRRALVRAPHGPSSSSSRSPGPPRSHGRATERITIVSNTPPRPRARARGDVAQPTRRRRCASSTSATSSRPGLHPRRGDRHLPRPRHEHPRDPDREGLRAPSSSASPRSSTWPTPSSSGVGRGRDRDPPQFDVGAIPYIADEAGTRPSRDKLFDYMAAGLAVLASDMAPVRRIVTETGVRRDRACQRPGIPRPRPHPARRSRATTPLRAGGPHSRPSSAPLGHRRPPARCGRDGHDLGDAAARGGAA